MRKLYCLLIVLALFTGAALGQVRFTGFSSGFGWSSKSTAYVSLGFMVNSNYHIIGTMGRPLFRQSFGSDIEGSEPFSWWSFQGEEVDHHMSGIAVNRLVFNRFSIGAGINFLETHRLAKFRSTTTELEFSKHSVGKRFAEYTFQFRYLLFDNSADRNLGDSIPLMLGLIYGTSGHLALDISVAIM